MARVMRLAPVLWLAVLAGCPSRAANELTADGYGGDDDRNPGGSEPAMCARDADCVLAGSHCCDCKTFAVSASDPTVKACAGVVCPGDPTGATCPQGARAACVERACEVVCEPLACDSSCEGGYATDPSTGCLSCACAGSPTLSGCMRDSDCVQTRADCCGCAAGGADTAVLASERDAFDAQLACPTAPLCPGTNTCDPAAEPRCIGGQCQLTASSPPPNACGRPDLPPCPAGTVCTVNTEPDANEQGVGVCTAPS